MTLFKTELSPGFPLSDARVDIFFYDSSPDAASSLDTLTIVVKTIGDNCFSAVLVCSYSLWRECTGIIELFIVGPVRSAKTLFSTYVSFGES